ncbi:MULTISPECIES: hypothetical protein [Streptomyces]|uniref:DUF4034 domain-containing protein n=2 Tax=Streptomyces fradiae ATCC 10745 = DSM 40063 TaxID=1319510 RepID=A0A1Y2NTE2_STRFR|nr:MULTISPECIES: hypothetical protein [Streptomyces]OSY50339.1 hypothetical protein BG846_04092 [Streptomyces fradiae ATCC 10745 = DSM 40063]
MALLRDRGLTLGRWTGRPGARLERDSGDPDVARMRAAAAAADWPAVRDLLEARPESEDRTGLLWAVGETAGVERWITDVLTAEPESALARTVAGIRYVSWGWEARTAARAKDVSRSQFELFHSRLRQAEEWLYEAAELEPDWTSPWYVLQVTGRGLEVGQVTARRRFEATVRRHPYHLGAHTQRLQQICEKWGGSHEEMHAFARESVFTAPGGTPLGRLVPDAHIEEWLSLDSGPDAAYMRRPEVAQSLRQAADHSYRHPDFVHEGPWLGLLNSFAMAFSLAGDRTGARECFQATQGRVTESPWDYLNASDPVAAYRKHRSAAGR